MKKNEKGKIIGLTEAEAIALYKKNKWDEVMEFAEFRAILEQDGTRIGGDGDAED